MIHISLLQHTSHSYVIQAIVCNLMIIIKWCWVCKSWFREEKTLLLRKSTNSLLSCSLITLKPFVVIKKWQKPFLYLLECQVWQTLLLHLKLHFNKSKPINVDIKFWSLWQMVKVMTKASRERSILNCLRNEDSA